MIAWQISKFYRNANGKEVYKNVNQTRKNLLDTAKCKMTAKLQSVNKYQVHHVSQCLPDTNILATQ